MSSLMKRFFVKLLIFVLVVCGLQLLMPLPYELKYKTQKQQFALKSKPDIFFFGDSALKWSAPSDPVDFSVPLLLKSMIREAVILKTIHSSFHMGVFEHNFRFYVRNGCVPEFLIIPINLRTFSPEWFRQPLWQFEEDFSLLAFHRKGWIHFYQPLSVFQLNKLSISQYDYEHTPVYKGQEPIGIIRDFDNDEFSEWTAERMRKKIIFRYMYELEPDHPRVQSMREIVRLAKEYGVKPIFYIMPIDYQTGQKYVGEEFSQQVQKNVRLIEHVLAEQGQTVLDLSRALPTRFFSWIEDDPSPLYPNEHLNFRGRLFIAQNLFGRTRLSEWKPSP